MKLLDMKSKKQRQSGQRGGRSSGVLDMSRCRIKAPVMEENNTAAQGRGAE